jgi:hypothetical protein
MGIVVKTTLDCFVGGSLHRNGDVFELPDGMAAASWMEVQDVAAKPKAAPKKKAAVKAEKEPETFSELTKREAEMLSVEGVDALI